MNKTQGILVAQQKENPNRAFEVGLNSLSEVDLHSACRAHMLDRLHLNLQLVWIPADMIAVTNATFFML